MESVNFLRLLLHPAIVVAMVISVLNFWLWCMVLSHYDLSFAYPLFSICFAAIMVCGALFFDEHLDRYKSIGDWVYFIKFGRIGDGIMQMLWFIFLPILSAVVGEFLLKYSVDGLEFIV